MVMFLCQTILSCVWKSRSPGRNIGERKALFQFRDLRAKTATEADELSGTKTAQAILGHTTRR
ncbi:hypothetical protein [Variovorax sp. LT1R16]|uniref:hypothetical protein n=1 Tax=Variovorax sp. LT1R16 TaxID=3443728 RepID=UPI003F48451E